MGMFDDLEVEDKALVEDKVSSGKKVNFDKIQKTGIVGMTIKNAYADMSKIKEYNDKKSGGAINITMELEGADGSLKTFEYVTAGVQKDRKPTFVYNKYRKLHYILTGDEVSIIPTTTGSVMVWDNEARQEVEQDKEVITAWIGKEVSCACVRVLEDKYNADGEMKDFVQVDAFLQAETNRSYAEVLADTPDAVYAKEFLEKRDEDFIIDKRKTTKSLPIPVILTKAEKDALAKAEEEANSMGGEEEGTPEIDIDEDEIPF